MAQLPDIKKKNGFFLGNFRSAPNRSSSVSYSLNHPPLTSHPDQASAPVSAPAHATAPPASAAPPFAPPATRPKRAGLGMGERRLFQMLCDWVVLGAGGFLIASVDGRLHDSGSVLLSVGINVVLWFFFADAFEAYRIPVIQSTFRSWYTVSKVLVLTVGFYALLAWIVGGSFPVIRPRVSETFETLLLVLPLLVERSLVSSLLTHAPLRRRVVVVGANRDGFEMGDALAHYDGKTYEFLGYFDDETRSPSIIDSRAPSSTGRNRQRIAQLVWPTSELLPIHENIGVDQVVLANPVQTVSLLSTLSLLHERGVQITPMFALYQDLTGRVPVSHLGDDWYVALPAHVKKNNRTYMLVKRTADIAMALVALVACSPVFPLVALAVKLDSPGPIFFRQVRVGRGGKLFKIAKFRTMRRDAEAKTGAVWATDSDPRITRVGKFLRKSRLDEVPQLWNVLVGDMSYVGPRPERPEFDEELEREIPFYRARRAVRPGLTGWAQVSHGYGNTLLDALRKVEYDLYYIKNASLYLDLLILLRTVAVVLRLGGK
jgi:exopolysaccharide biosynthesis polyprenyl glycosylphosphotransferase